MNETPRPRRRRNSLTARNQAQANGVLFAESDAGDIVERRMLKCTLCGRPLEATAAWKGRGERYYCGEFCAEAEDIESPPLVPNAAADAPAFAKRQPLARSPVFAAA
jgi:hypothetical protein